MVPNQVALIDSYQQEKDDVDGLQWGWTMHV